MTGAEFKPVANPKAVLVSEILILPDGNVLAHNLTPVFTALLSQLNPRDQQISPRVEKSGNTNQPTRNPTS